MSVNAEIKESKIVFTFEISYQDIFKLTKEFILILDRLMLIGENTFFADKNLILSFLTTLDPLLKKVKYFNSRVNQSIFSFPSNFLIEK